ncbi:MAG: ribonucleoside-diphosphate reductase subunit alpha [Patescibacteria group bacterium]
MPINIKKIDGRLEAFEADKINRAVAAACAGLPEASAKITQIATETELTLYDGITTLELDQALINAAVQNIKDDPDFDIVATRLLLKTIYKEVLGDFKDRTELLEKHRHGFPAYITRAIKAAWLSTELEVFNLEELAQALDLERDQLLTYTGLSTMKHRYLIKSAEQKLQESPQYFWMRVAMGLAYKEKDPTASAKLFYHKMSRLEYIPGGSTNINAGSKKPALSNCFILDMEDNIDHIGKTVSDVMKLSKATGGIGLSVTKLRANGSPISTNNTFSSGPVPFLHIIDSTIRAISRAGKKMGALCFYMENWHLDFQDFLDLKQNAGDDYRRTRTADTAVYLSDEFMKRVDNNDWWYLFDPKETPDLVDLSGQAFSQRYQEYIEKAEKGELRAFQKIKAGEQFRQIIISLQGTSHPWLTWKDAINIRALNDNTGPIYSSNLCTEITLPTNKDNVAVCNLLSLNLARHLKTEGNKIEIDWANLKDSVRLGIRQLDNLVDINQPPVPEAINFDSHNRALGLGVMGLADLLEKMGLAYDSPEAFELSDRLMEFISYQAIDTSADLAQERGSYSNFSGSLWSKGYLPYDTIKRLADNRGREISVSLSKSDLNLDWEALKNKSRQGMRNSTLLAIAPTANIGLVAGTSTGIDPRFAQIFSRNTLSGKYLELNFNLASELKALGIWEKVREKILAAQGDLSQIEEIPLNLKNIYKDSFSVDPKAFIEIAARAQKWVDQAISRNMYLSTRDTDEIMKIYQTAWGKGLKTTYYLHLKPRHTAEQSTVKVNKAENSGKKGFGALWASNETKTGKTACPIDPQERLLCDSCQ